ncbi:MAG: sulfite exporter TauE/SafE family protein [Corynebacterium sp.]|nr:sulfite exporter TauE/SafE family protein [Corynebacterium sp.]
MRTLILIALAGAAAQLVDGGIGMGFGVTSTSILIILAGLGPAQASAVVHTAELGTTFVSGFSHWRFGNVDWKLVISLAIPGAIAAFAGATVLSNISTGAAKPITSTILFLIGLSLVWRFSQGRIRREVKKRYHSRSFLIGLGSVGGFLDASGGGGWGPVTTSTLLALGKEQPRRVVGTVNTAEFFVTLGATLGFVFGLWDDLVANLAAVVALLAGGIITAPIAAWLISIFNPVALGGLVGTGIAVLNVARVYGALGNWLGFEVSTPAAWVIHLGLLIGGIALTVRGVKAAKNQPETNPEFAEPELELATPTAAPSQLQPQ